MERMMRYLLAIMMLLFLAGCDPGQKAGQATPVAAANVTPVVGEGQVTVGEPAPYFRLVATNGNVLDLQELQGEVLVLNFWATWCAPCRIEMPELQAAYDEHRDDGLKVIGIEVQTSGSIQESREFLDAVGVSFPIVRDAQGLMERRYLARPALPTTIFIDRNGIVAYVQIGPMTREFIEERLDAMDF